MPAPPPESEPAMVSAMGVMARRQPQALRLPTPRARRAWRGGAGGGGRRLLGASIDAQGCKFGASVGPPPLAPQLRCVARPSPPMGGRVTVLRFCALLTVSSWTSLAGKLKTPPRIRSCSDALPHLPGRLLSAAGVADRPAQAVEAGAAVARARSV